jgi:hypothetical protein
MNAKMSIECKHCDRHGRMTVEFGQQHNNRVGVLVAYLPPGWEIRTGDRGWATHNRAPVTFICNTCAKVPKGLALCPNCFCNHPPPCALLSCDNPDEPLEGDPAP